jgi:hypothetical protein
LGQIPYILPQYGFLFETNFGIEAPDQYSCRPSRPSQPLGSYIPDRLSLVNHFLYARFFGIRKPAPSHRLSKQTYRFHPLQIALIDDAQADLSPGYPNASYANTTNGAGFHVGELGEHAARCRSLYNKRPNFLQVDFFNEGDVFDVEYGMNAY